MAQPFGQWLVGLAGAVVIGVGLYHFVKAYRAAFMDNYDTGSMSAKEQDGAKWIGRFGLAARGVVFCMIGSFLIRAAVQADPTETRGLEGALESLLGKPFGPWLLTAMSAGLLAFGIYCFSRARYSRFVSS